ncbi:uncharacterized protein AMSG_04289 [Thecamonas trahens ATCC 50062]|uniref:Glutaredoxin domain-containing protein n=1 Tax=Thecamonas trahens ATCC 50062 TaxID=461836 RepID=A0A0L0D6Q3_THETB|nr:hypothetical protein AMSG_04289 [Thecamonas trahens ATCC 50062]KNC48057.1 hypothetical protein AMSG_04289 [Thecamonas trahens ATCC 50062]|eukprot:XP_013759072.1 hypothetical protein AMSG_04289 [Thecamonas trahens ATCC 50062]
MSTNISEASSRAKELVSKNESQQAYQCLTDCLVAHNILVPDLTMELLTMTSSGAMERQHALDTFAAALVTARAAGDQVQEGMVLSGLGFSLLRSSGSDLELAVAALQRASDLAEEAGNAMGVAIVAPMLAEAKQLLAAGVTKSAAAAGGCCGGSSGGGCACAAAGGSGGGCGSADPAPPPYPGAEAVVDEAKAKADAASAVAKSLATHAVVVFADGLSSAVAIIADAHVHTVAPDSHEAAAVVELLPPGLGLADAVFVGGKPRSLESWSALSVDDAVAAVEAAELERQARIDGDIAAVIASAPRMLFMKGTPDRPRCKFSRKCVTALADAGIDYASFDILSSWDVRHRLKAYSGLATFPQFWVDGALVGGTEAVGSWITTSPAPAP